MNLKGVLFFCFYDSSYFQDAVPLLNQAKKVLFPWDLKASHFSKLKHCIPTGERRKEKKETYKGFWIKMYPPPCFANSVSQISNNAGSLRHHREVSDGLLQEDIKGAAEKQAGVRVPCQIQTVRIPCSILPGEMKALCGTSFPGCAKFSGGGPRAPSATYNYLTALLSSEM